MDLFTKVFLISFLSFAQGENIVVETTQGLVQGRIDNSRNGKKFNSFLGIPYGKIIARFQESTVPDGWNDILKADKFGPICTQWNSNKDKIIGEENCLFLNVYTPKGFDKSSKLPVMFFIHGGSFVTGASNVYGPKYIMDEKVVFVTINYRLGVLGFLNGDDQNAPGNVGLKDMVLALQWVRANILNFGGNPQKVTIFGESAGSASINFLIVSPLTKDLFYSAIAQSGAALNNWALSKYYLNMFYKFGNLNNCTNNSKDETLKCLRETPLETIMKNSKDSDNLPMVPSVENCENCLNNRKFISKTPLEIYKAGEFQKVPLMIGVNKDEITMFTLMMGIDSQNDINNIFKSGYHKTLLPALLYYSWFPNKDEITEKVQNFYFGGTNVIPSRAQFHDVLNDRVFTFGIRNTAIYHSKYAKTYLYQFDRPGEISFAKFLGGKSTRNDGKFEPTHADELLYLMNPLDVLPSSKEWVRSKDGFVQFTYNMTKLWTSFAKFGYPKKIYGKEKKWKDLKSEKIKWFHLDDSTQNRIEDEKFTARMKFWKDLNLEEN